jgi:hypothetical protein
VVVEVEEARSIGTDPQAKHHIAELRDGRVGDHPLYVFLDQRHGRSHECRKAADVGDDEHGRGALDEDVIGARHEVDARSDHGCGVDQGAHRSRALHGVGEPHVQRELRALADGAEEDEDHGRCEQGAADKTGLGSLRDVREGRRARRSPEDDYPDKQRSVTDSGHYKSLDRGVAGGRFLEPVSDEQVGA